MKSSLDKLELSVGSFSSDELPTVGFRKCLVEDCKNQLHRNKSYCSTHYYRYKRYGDPLKLQLHPRYKMSICNVNGCNKLAKSREMCKFHHQHFIRNGDATITLHEMHGYRKKPEYSVWCSMKARCNNPNNGSYAYYGGRGIKVCDRWLHSFKNFIEDMEFRPTSDYSIERIDNDGDYEPDNCKWATRREQRLNQRKRGIITV